MKQLAFLLSLGATLLLLQACGGGGGGDAGSATTISYSGLTSEARVESTNAESLSTAAASGALQSVAAESASSAFARPMADFSGKLLEIAPRIAMGIVQSEFYAAKITDLSSLCDAGGTAIADTNDAETVGTIAFTNCRMSDGYGSVLVLNGVVDYTFNSSADSMAMTFNITMTYAGETAVMNMTLNCVNFTSASPTCSVTSDFAGLDGRIYRVTDITVTGDAFSGFTISATVYDPDYGHVDMVTTTPITFDCGTGVPGTGSVAVYGSSGTSGAINFVSCSEYNVTVNGVTDTYFW